MTDLEMNPEAETEEFSEELSDEVLDREGVRFCAYSMRLPVPVADR
jgi:hypothetical protein